MATPEESSHPQDAGSSWAEFTRSLAAEAPNQPQAAPERVPTLAEQLESGNLTGNFIYDPVPEANLQYQPRDPGHTVQMSEAEGLPALRDFLAGYVETGHASDDPAEQELARRASDMLENMTYISDTELTHATATMAENWKQFLDSDPEAAVYLWAEQYKSNDYILDRALSHFSDEDLEKYRGRLHLASTLGGYRPPGAPPREVPANNKVIMVDDWMTSGRQMAAAYETRLQYPGYEPGQLHYEINLVVATTDQLRDGLGSGNGIRESHLPVHAVYQANEMQTGRPTITGIHSSTDDEFEIPIQQMVESERRHGRSDAVMPPLTNIDRPYRAAGYTTGNVDRLRQLYSE